MPPTENKKEGKTKNLEGLALQLSQLCPDLLSWSQSVGDQEEEEEYEEEDEEDNNTIEVARYKTEFCRNFKEKGSCSYQDHCEFAHGEHELRKFDQDIKYKTKRCQTYWVNGTCFYGPRCKFLHNEKDQAQSSGPGGCSTNTPRASMSHSILMSKLPATPVPLVKLFRPRYGSGRLAAVIKEGEYYWIDTYTQKYV